MNSFTPEPEPYRYQRYPLVMHRGTDAKRIHDAEQEKAAVADGYGLSRPAAAPAAAGTGESLTIEDRIAALEADVAELKAKRGPGRPKAELKPQEG